MKLFAVIHQTAIFDAFDSGIFSTKEKALEKAKVIAEENSYPSIDENTWGEKDDYGLLEGVLIVERTVDG